MPLSFLIVDDERLSRDYIRDLIVEFDPTASIEDASSVEIALPILEKSKTDIVFLDVKMPGMDGFSLLELSVYKDFELIVITAYSEYAIKAFKEGACDYLLKPIKKSEFKTALTRTIARREKELVLRNFPTSVLENLYLNTKLIINHQQGLKIITLKDVIYLNADNTYTTIYTSSGEKIVTSKPINYFEKTLDPKWFFRIHKSNLINLHHFKEYNSLNDNVALMKNGVKLHISRYRLRDFLQRIKDIT